MFRNDPNKAQILSISINEINAEHNRETVVLH